MANNTTGKIEFGLGYQFLASESFLTKLYIPERFLSDDEGEVVGLLEDDVGED